MIISVYNLKGGVGKSTTAINLLYNLALEGNKVLGIDLDPQCNLTPFYAQANEMNTIADALIEPNRFDDIIEDTKYKGISLIKGSTKLKDELFEPSSLLNMLKVSKRKQEFDYVIIDCRTSCENLTLAALMATDMVLTPIILDGYCRDNLIEVQNIIENVKEENPKLQWNVFVNKLKHRKAQRSILEDLIAHYEYPIFDICVMERAAVENSLALRKPLVRHASKNQATLDFQDLARRVMEEEGGI
ncbi:chromosome partitioning protein [Aequitasia blattaphilus]|uniref:AAA family ATPase n=1 Tax=Aequitasia blattaphilus TaxID=2949332 RepID=A0ABT1E8K6_9FIRM|nr:AAA family ATPase [Aequitasia blattaphilus]MCP1101964.1 AAA family ATPase [Aequitasia blattaphilus]MCR8614604.1 AAA family ATPase [Aequitasia blattaphilus]